MISTNIRLAARNAMRRKIRTGLAAAMIVAGVSLLLLLISWIQGASHTLLGAATASGGHVRVVDPDYALREQLAPLEEHIRDAATLAAAVAREPGVTGVEPRIATGATVTAGDEIGEVFARVYGANESYFRDRLKAHEKLVAGAWFSGAEGELIAGSSVVNDTGAKVGDELVLLGVTQDGSLSPIKGKLVGVVKGDSEINQVVLAPLAKVQWMTDIEGGATELLIYGADFELAPSLAAHLRRVPALAGYAVEAWSEREPWKTLGGTMRAIEWVIIMVVVFLVALGIWNTMMMSVLERTHEIGVLRALGMSRLGAVGLFVGEAIAIGVIGGLAGVALGALPSWYLESHGFYLGEKVASASELAIGETIHGDLSLHGVLLAFVLGVVMAALGSLLPSLRAASIQPVSAMKSGR